MTKADIIKTAFQVWGRSLYQSTSLSDIAQALGVSKSALYRHFKSKQALLDAMYEWFFDEYAAFIKPQYHKARASEDKRERLLIMVRIMVEYYIRNRDTSIFSLILVYGNQHLENMVSSMVSRGLDMREFWGIEEGNPSYPSFTQLVIASLIFFVAYFHKCDHPSKEAPSDEQVRQFVGWVEEKIACGLGLYQETIEALDFEELESRFDQGVLRFNIDKCPQDMQGSDKKYKKSEDESLLKAIAAVVAEAGPWNASMDMVARRSGLSKSGLYSHFKNKQDMIRYVFIEEFKRILRYAQVGLTLSTVPEEQLYLVILSIVDCLRSRPEILQAIDWLRTRHLNIDSKPAEILHIFSAIPLQPEGLITEQIGHLIFFLIINTLMHRPPGMAFSEFPNRSIRILYRFITLGITPPPTTNAHAKVSQDQGMVLHEPHRLYSII
ncbi:MAG: TetR/AcrR family transcriptional regulator [Treponema sp.]|jgi:AcrR family transcriptional regulator|nr:TetR/AcrR family transcriptional regulator [Treponema sp.]